ncbi:MAG: ABC transporter ATP-binding protein [Candidatus Accumulibacter sp.]|jgi:putative ABC transport system ATP-binding protein|nr:ABC transporter ATP-binding protein [Accumulibacter sp.]
MLLEINGLRKEYERGEHRFAAVDDLCLRLERGEFVCLFGRSGSGKTTLLNMIAGLITPDSGEILFDGVGLYSLDDPARTAWRNEKLGYMPQGASLLSNLSVLDNIRLPFHLQPRSGGSLEKARELTRELGISRLEKSYPSALSGGEMRRVALARALMNSPELVIADEPSNDLDAQTAREMASLLSVLNGRGCAFLVATHDQELGRLGRTLEIANGRLLDQDHATEDREVSNVQ